MTDVHRRSRVCRRPLGASAVLAIALAACRPAATTPPSEPRPHPVPAERADPTPRVVDLGPADPVLPPLVAASPEPFTLPALPSRARLGRKASGTKPAAGDEPLLVAIAGARHVVARTDSYVHVAAWRPDGRPAAGARVFLGEQEIGRTDRHGALAVSLPIASATADTLWVLDGPRCGTVELPALQPREGQATDHLFAYTDRGVYRPGDTLRLRGIAWRLAASDRPLRDADIEVTLRDPAGHVVTSAIARTDELGIVAADLPIATTALEGVHTLAVAHGDARAQTGVLVRPFAPVALRIEHTLPFDLPRGARRLAFDLRLSDPVGEPARGAEVEIELSVRGRVRHTIREHVDGDGPHAFSVGRDDLDRVRAGTEEGDVVLATVRVTDDQGREEEATRELRIVPHRFVPSLTLDRALHATGEPVEVALRLLDLERVPQRRTPVELRLAHGDARTTVQAETDGGGLATFRFDMPAARAEAELLVDELDTPIARMAIPWEPHAAMRAATASEEVAAHEETEIVVRFAEGWTPVGDVVHGDLVDATGAIVDAFELPVKRGRAGIVARGRVRAPDWGTARLSLFALGRRGAIDAPPPRGSADVDLALLTAGASMTVDEDRTLSVVLDGVPDKARPGAPIEVRARVRDARGEAVDASIGAALVDSAVLALKDPLARSPAEVLHDARRRTRAMAQSDLPARPVLARNWGDARHDVARAPGPLFGGAVMRCGDPVGTTPDPAAGRSAPDDDEPASTSRPRARRDRAASRPIQTEITLRTRVPTTSTWAPGLRTGDAIAGTLSGTLGEQELVVVASDATGGVGMARAKIRVAQPLSVRADLPASIVVDERVEIPVVVHNATDTKHHVDVELRASDAVETDALDVFARRQDSLALPLQADARGPLGVRVQATGSGHGDAIERTIEVRSNGLPVAHTTTASLDPGTTGIDLEIPPGDAGNDAALEIRLPLALTALLGARGMSAAVTDDPRALVVDLATASTLLGGDVPGPLRAALRGRAIAALGLLRLLQRPDGGFGARRNGPARIHETTLALEGLTDAEAAGLPVPAEMLERTAGWLAARTSDGTLAGTTDLREYDGEPAIVREGVTARIFAALARLDRPHRTAAIEAALEAQTRRFRARIADPDLDPVTRAHALVALVARGAASAQEVASASKRLAAAASEGRVRSAWSHPLEGREAGPAFVAIALHETGSASAGETIRRLASPGSIAAQGRVASLRALVRLGAPPPTTEATVEVLLDGRSVTRVTIDPADPLAGLESLASVPLGRDLAAGSHRVEVRIDGSLVGTARLMARVWTPGEGTTSERSSGRLSAHGPDAIAAGGRAVLRVEAGGAARRGATIRIARSALVEVDRAALARRAGPGHAIESFRIDDEAVHLRLSLRRADVAIDVPLRAARRGTGPLPAVALDPLEGGGPTLVVDPGPVRVD